MKRIAALIVVMLLFVSASSTALHARQEKAPDIQSVKRELKILRGLDFKRDVPWSYKTRQELLKTFKQEMESENSQGELARASAFLAWMHLVPEGFDFPDFIGKYLSESVAGFYLPKTKTFYITRDDTGSDIPDSLAGSGFDTQKITALHEMDHALQDQYFDLEKLMDYGRKAGNDDIDLSVQSLIEGDAAYVTVDGIFKELNQDLLTVRNLDTIIAMLFTGAPSKKSRQVPAFISGSLSAPYTEGFHFIKDAILCGGWDLVNAVYGDLPDSTEQILHPEKYFVERDFPYVISMSSMPDEMPDGWKKSDENTVGELQLKLIFNTFFPSQGRSAAYEGWGGDRYRIYSRGRDNFAVWVTVWDTPKDAAEFFDGYGRILKKKYTGLKISRDSRTSFEGSAAGGSILMESRDRTVTIMEGVPSSLVAAVKEKLQSCQAERKEHPVKVKVNELKKAAAQSSGTGTASGTGAVASGSARSGIEFNKYTNSNYGFSVQKPDSWIFKPSQYTSRTPLTIGNLNTGAFVTFQIIPSNSSVSQQVIEENLNSFSMYALGGYKRTGSGTKSIGGHTFYFLNGTGVDKSTRVATSINAYGADMNRKVFIIFVLVPKDREADSSYDINMILQSILFL